MILIIGPAYSGKKEYAGKILRSQSSRREELMKEAESATLLTEVQEMVTADMDEAGIKALADFVCERYQILTASETGAGIVPMGKDMRALRDLQGRLLCELSGRAECVVRVFYGIPELLKGDIPC